MRYNITNIPHVWQIVLALLILPQMDAVAQNPSVSDLLAEEYYVNDLALDDLDVQYIRIVGTSKFLSTKVNVDIEFGQHDKFFAGRDTRIVDSSGKQVTFNSMVDALNFMAGLGYDFVQAYAFAVGNQTVYHYLMQKKEA